jgi:type VI secretion system secreted protein VgrG
MKKFNKKGIIVTILVFSFVFGFSMSSVAYAATSPTLVGSLNYSILGATTVTNTGATTTVGEVGVSAGTAITGFPPGIAGGIILFICILMMQAR